MGKYPRVLIMGETFHYSSGGGVTLCNLFKKFSPESLAVISSYITIGKSIPNMCHNYYCLGKSNVRILWPFNYFIKVPSSGSYNASNSSGTTVYRTNKKAKFLKKISYFIGISPILIKYRISKNIIEWINDFNPDILYVQCSGYAMLSFVEELHNIIGLPMVFHVMDDWISINQSFFLSNMWKRKTECVFKKILSHTSLNLSISEGMSEEYLRRYGKKFIPFHNPIDVDKWINQYKINYSINQRRVTMLHSGRIGYPTSTSIIELARAITKINNEGMYLIELQIQSPFIPEILLKQIRRFSCINIIEPVSHSELPNVYSKVDLLVIPIDFSKKAERFCKFSMSTKISEFMISGTPIILYAPESIFMVQHAKQYGWAKLITNNNIDYIADDIIEVIKSMSYREKVGKNARIFSVKNYNSHFIRAHFEDRLISVIK